MPTTAIMIIVVFFEMLGLPCSLGFFPKVTPSSENLLGVNAIDLVLMLNVEAYYDMKDKPSTTENLGSLLSMLSESV